MIATTTTKPEAQIASDFVTPRKKKCSGTCLKCVRKRLLNRRSGVTENNNLDEDSETVSVQPELLGIEFDGKTRRTNWRGSFAGTPEF